MGLTIGKTIDDYTYWVDGPELQRDKRKSISKSRSSSSYKSVKSRSSLNKSKGPPPLPFKEGENVYGLKRKSNKKRSKSNKKKSSKKTKKKSKGTKDKLKRV